MGTTGDAMTAAEMVSRPKPSAFPIRLACYVSTVCGCDWGCYARLDLDAPTVAQLLSFRDIYRAAADKAEGLVANSLYTVRLWDYRVDFFANPPDRGEQYLEVETDWSYLPRGLVFTAAVRTECDTIHLDRDGVRWAAYVGDLALETGEITWAQLEAVVGGDNPFPATEVG